MKEQLGPEKATMDTLEQMCSKDMASQHTSYDWELFMAMHEVTAEPAHRFFIGTWNGFIIIVNATYRVKEEYWTKITKLRLNEKFNENVLTFRPPRM